MRVASFVLALSALSLASIAAASTCKARPTTCEMLEKRYPGTVSWPDDETYIAENEAFWSPTTYNTPSCVFVPENAKQVSGAVKLLVKDKTQFAVRGGGHMPILGYSNTDSGVLIAMSKLNSIELSKDQSYVSVGPGLTWGEVYKYLEPHGLIAVGGRVGLVGVPGLILGGGISFYSSQYGFASDNVVAFEVVLASGKIVTATKDNKYSDLFWALKGGGNSFGIVTRFDLETYASPKVCAGVKAMLPLMKDKFLDAVASFAKDGANDPKAAVIPQIIMMMSLKITMYSSALFYDGEECDQPALANLTGIIGVLDDYGPKTLSEYVAGTDALIPPGVRQQFQVVSSFATRESLQIVHDNFVEMLNEEIADVAGLQASIAFQPITKNFIQQGIDKGGNPQGIDVSKAPYFWMVINYSWSNAEDDQRISDFATKATATINEKLTEAGKKAHFQYLNDAGEGQQVFQSYDPANLQRLKKIRTKYDPSKVFTELLSGGWKVEDV